MLVLTIPLVVIVLPAVAVMIALIVGLLQLLSPPRPTSTPAEATRVAEMTERTRRNHPQRRR